MSTKEEQILEATQKNNELLERVLETAEAALEVLRTLVGNTQREDEVEPEPPPALVHDMMQKIRQLFEAGSTSGVMLTVVSTLIREPRNNDAVTFAVNLLLNQGYLETRGGMLYKKVVPDG